MPNLGPTELIIIVLYLLFLLIPVAVLYFIIRQAVLSALRMFYRELDGTEEKKIQKQVN
ncbi:MAG: hypothetical protein OXG53_13790 [Chloroflexi bacterium]|nr:hypothetical protein [Chloroflexota bacterium]